VIGNAVSAQASNQFRDIEAPAHNPEDASIRFFSLKAVAKKSEIVLTLTVRDHFRDTEARQKTGCLQLNAEPATSETISRTGNQKANQRCGHRSGCGRLRAAFPLTAGQETK
jgi:hypothetical protein